MAGRHRAMGKQGKLLRGLPIAVAMPTLIGIGHAGADVPSSPAPVAEFASATVADVSSAPFSAPAAPLLLVSEQPASGPVGHDRIAPVRAARPPVTHVAYDAAQHIPRAAPTPSAAAIAGPIENATYLGSTAGQLIGGVTGAVIGGALGSALPVPGKAGIIGGAVVGGVLGTYAGYYAGAHLGTGLAVRAPHLVPAVLP